MTVSQAPAKQADFKPHVQGLRAIAVLSVFAHHISEAWLPGGFVGVDVFFVISGFLITSHIVGQGDGFTLSGFYMRRVRRIIPNQLLVIALVILAAFALAPNPAQIVASGAWSAAMLSNVFFYRQAGYFAPDADTMPLLHMWSLAVEEQFYLIWPLAIIGLMLTRRRAAIIAAVFVALLIATEFAISRDPDAAFYLTPFRIVEFMVGGALSFVSVRKPPYAAPVALAVIAACMVLYSPETRFPGVMALVPAVATAALILWGGEGWIGRFLGSRPGILIGDRSYALYLVHWPVLAFLYMKFPTSDWRGLVAVPLAFALTEVIYRYWEKPLRYRALPGRRFAYESGILAAAVVLAVGGGALAGRKAMANFSEPRTPQLLGCANPDATIATCETDTLVIGDSHTGHVQEIVGGARSYFPGCPPLFGAYKLYTAKADRWKTPVCRDLVRQWEDEVLRSKARRIVLAARWDWLAEPGLYAGEEVRRDPMLRKDGDPQTVEHSRKVIAEQLAFTVDALRRAGKEVVVFGQVPLRTKAEIACANAKRSDRECQIVGRDEALARLAFMDRLLKGLDVPVVLPSEILCRGDCVLVAGGKPLYKDTNHLNSAGAAYVRERLPHAP